MSSLQDDIERGCLETGEAIEAKWGPGWWTPGPEPEPEITQCPLCGAQAYDLGDAIDCERCGVIQLNELVKEIDR